LLYQSSNEYADIKITDFGVGRFLDGNDLATTAVGTPSYMAPEVIAGLKYGKEVDIWAIGVILYIMLCGFPPFHDENNEDLFNQIKSGKFDFPSPYWDQVSNEAKDLITFILEIDPAKRPGAG